MASRDRGRMQCWEEVTDHGTEQSSACARLDELQVSIVDLKSRIGVCLSIRAHGPGGFEKLHLDRFMETIMSFH